MSYRINMSTRHDKGGWAVYLPAWSTFYLTMYQKIKDNKPGHSQDRIPATFENGIEGFNVLNKDKAYYHYRYGLYSAGHAELDLSKTMQKEEMIQNRDKEHTVIVGDSGGFQIATGVMKLDWANFKDKSNDPIREKILRWLEHTSDYAMTLDIPAVAACAPFNKKTGLTKFEETLDYSVHNLHYFVKNRVPGKTNFLNVLSGSTVDNSRTWFEAVKGFSDPVKMKEMGYTEDRTLEGYAFAGVNMRVMSCTLERILRLRDEGLLQDKKWIHCLGVGRLDWACYLTSIQRQIKKHINPNLTISFDAASPFVATAYGLTYTYNMHTPKRWGYNMEKAIDDKKLVADQMQMPFGGPIMDRLNVSDICVLGAPRAMINGKTHFDVSEEEVKELASQGIDAVWIEGEKNKQGKVGKTSWDTVSYMFYMAHNVYNHINAVQEANRISDIEIHRLVNKVNLSDWRILKRSEPDNLSPYVPSNVIYFEKFVQELFDPANKNPYEMLDHYQDLLDSISFGVFRKDHSDDLFDEADEVDLEDTLVDMNNEKIIELEHGVIDDEE